MKIYSFPYSLPSYRARLAASLMGYDYDVATVDISKGQQNSDTYLKVNPLGKIPSLVDESVTVGDSLAIIRYLARKSDNTHWYPDTNIELAAKIDILLSMVANELFDSVEKGRLIKTFKMFSEDGLADCDLLAHGLLTIFNDNLSNSKYLVGDVPTIADIAVLSTLLYMDEAGLSTQKYTNVFRWIEDMKKLSGFIEPVKL